MIEGRLLARADGPGAVVQQPAHQGGAQRGGRGAPARVGRARQGGRRSRRRTPTPSRTSSNRRAEGRAQAAPGPRLARPRTRSRSGRRRASRAPPRRPRRRRRAPARTARAAEASGPDASASASNATSTSARSAADGCARPWRRCSAWKGRGRPPGAMAPCSPAWAHRIPTSSSFCSRVTSRRMASSSGRPRCSTWKTCSVMGMSTPRRWASAHAAAEVR